MLDALIALLVVLILDLTVVNLYYYLRFQAYRFTVWNFNHSFHVVSHPSDRKQLKVVDEQGLDYVFKSYPDQLFFRNLFELESAIRGEYGIEK